MNPRNWFPITAVSSQPNIEMVMSQAAGLELAAQPASDSHSIYTEMCARYLAIESQLDRTAKWVSNLLGQRCISSNHVFQLLLWSISCGLQATFPCFVKFIKFNKLPNLFLNRITKRTIQLTLNLGHHFRWILDSSPTVTSIEFGMSIVSVVVRQSVSVMTTCCTPAWSPSFTQRTRQTLEERNVFGSWRLMSQVRD